MPRLSRPLLLTVMVVLTATAALALHGAHVRHPIPVAVALVLGSAWLGWLARQLWSWPRRLAQAELRWAVGCDPREVLDLLQGTQAARGEVGYRTALLRAEAHLAAADRQSAWGAGLEAQLLRLAPWQRWQALRFLATTHDHADPATLRVHLTQGEALARRLPTFSRLRHILAMLYLKQGHASRAWVLLEEALLRSPEDALLLEDILLTALPHLEVLQATRQPLPETGPTPVFFGALARLLFRHGDPRLPWDRARPARFLLFQGHHEMVLALAQSLPEPLRPPELWAAEIGALRDLGDLDGAAEAVKEACAIHRGSFELWLARHEVAVERHKMEEASHALAEAGALLAGVAEEATERYVWKVRQAEYIYWERGEAEQAWDLLQQVPEALRGGQQPPLELELLVALERYEEAYQGVLTALKETPEDVDLLLLQADCLAGMGAWEALPAFLEPLKDPVRARGDYWNLLGLALGHLGQKITSRDHLERAAFMESQDLSFVLDAGHACMELGEWDRAAHHWQQALRLDERSEEALVQLAQTRRLLHDPEGAKRYLRECLLQHPQSTQAQEYLAELESN